MTKKMDLLLNSSFILKQSCPDSITIALYWGDTVYSHATIVMQSWNYQHEKAKEAQLVTKE